MLVCLLHIFVCLLVLDVSSSFLIISNLQRNKILSIFGFQGTICMTFHHTVGLSGLEPPTSRLSGVRSNRLSYKPSKIWQPPALPCRLQHSTIGRLCLNRRVRDGNGCVPQPHRHQNSSEPLSEIQQYIKPLLLLPALVGLIQLHSATYL